MSEKLPPLCSGELLELTRRFQRTSDPRAIASLYVLTAPRLLRTAAALGCDAGDAEDLVHATFVAVLESIDRFDEERPVMPWLIGILANQLRRHRRDRARVVDGVRMEGTPSPDPFAAIEAAEVVERISRRLQGLPRHYREVVAMRWMNGLTSSQIARDLGIPRETVKTRLRRGQEIVRQGLTSGLTALALSAVSGRGAKAATFDVPSLISRGQDRLLGHVTSSTAANTVGVAGAVSANSSTGSHFTWALAPIVAGCAIAGLCFAWASRDTRDATLESTTRAPGHDFVQEATAGPEDRGEERSRALSPTSVASVEVGTVALRVRYGDGTPAPEVSVGVEPRGGADPRLRRVWYVSDDEGNVVADGLLPGSYAVFGDRGGVTTVEVPAGQTATGELRLDEGVSVTGRVIAGPKAVAGAEVWLSTTWPPGEGRCVTTTDTNGHYAIRDVTPGRCVSVLADGFLPAEFRRVDGAPGESCRIDVDLSDCESGLEIHGRVIDELGQPVEGALVQLGRLEEFELDGTVTSQFQNLPPIELRTDAEGRFFRRGFSIFDRILEIWVRAPGRAVAFHEAYFDEPSESVEIEQAAVEALVGRALDAEGTPVGGAKVTVFDPLRKDAVHAPAWSHPTATSAVDGTFCVEGVPAGDLVVSVRSDSGDRALAILKSSSERSYDAVLARPGSVRGQLIDDAGRPLVGLRVELRADRGVPCPEPTTTDVAGRFVIVDCDDLGYTLAVTAPESPWGGDLLVVPSFHPSAKERRLVLAGDRLPSVVVEGLVVDAEGAPVATRLLLRSDQPGYATAIARPDGGFRFESLPCLPNATLYAEDRTGRWLLASVGELRPGAVVSLGSLTLLSPGSLEVAVIEPSAARVPDVVVRLSHPGGTRIKDVAVNAGSGSCNGLAPGRYVLHCTGSTVALNPTEFEIRPGERTRVEVEAATSRVMRFTVQLHGELTEFRGALHLDFAWCDAQGAALCHDRYVIEASQPIELEQAFAPGDYQLHIVGHPAGAGLVSFAVDEGVPGAAAVIQVPLR